MMDDNGSQVDRRRASVTIVIGAAELENDGMARNPLAVPFTFFSVDQSSSVPLYRQLYDSLREAILAGQLAPGMRLPSTRTIARDLGLSRNTVMNAFEQLIAEGYVQGQVGAGTWVAHELPDELLSARTLLPQSVRPLRGSHSLSRRGSLLEEAGSFVPRVAPPAVFRPGLPALDQFPFDVWGRLTARRWRRADTSLLGYGDPAGYRPLREAVAAYLSAARAVRCVPEQVIVVSGAQQGLDLVARILLDPGDAVWMEDPGYMGATGALLAAGARLVPVPVDGEGLQVDEGIKRFAYARLAYVTPSHQFPLGVSMSLARRLALLEWASRASAWIVEDDYDSEFRYRGRPPAALQGLDRHDRVIYLGTFSKLLFPALRLGYLIVPPDLVDSFVPARAVAGWGSPTIEQAVLADFLVEGHFAHHLRRMRALYAERQAVLLEAGRAELQGLLDLEPDDAGMQLVGWLPEGVVDTSAALAAAAHDVMSRPISGCSIDQSGRGGLLLGYTGAEPAELRAGVHRLAIALAGSVPVA